MQEEQARNEAGREIAEDEKKDAEHKEMKTAVIIRGGGCQGAVVLDLLMQLSSHTIADDAISSRDKDYYVWDDGEDDQLHPLFEKVTRLRVDSHDYQSTLKEYKVLEFFVAVGSGTTRQNLVSSARQIFESDHCIIFPSLIHPTANVSPTAIIGEGCFVGPFAAINTCAGIGAFVLVNTSAIVEHDCIVKDYVTLNPASTLLGSVTVASFTTVGAHATIRDSCSVFASHTTIGMGAMVVSNINPPTVHGFWAGVPAKPVLRPSSSSKKCLPSSGNTVRWCYKKPLSSQRFLLYLQPSLEKGHVTNDGPLQVVLQSKVKGLVRSHNQVLLTSNGTSALHALCTGLALKCKKKLRWVTQAFTFPSSIMGPLAGCKIADIDQEWYGPSRTYLEAHLDDFDGIIVTNVFGLQTNLPEYERWCHFHHKLLVLDNAATPIGFLQDEQSTSIHDIGDGAIISFHETKPFGRGEGGAVFARSDVLRFVHQAMNFGYDIPHQLRVPNKACSNWRMSDIAAAAICDHIDFMMINQWQEKLQDLTKFAVSELENNNLEMAMPVKYPTVLSCLFIRLPQGITPERILKFLHSRSIEAKHYYEPLCGREEAPETWKLFDSTICLPFHLGISKNELADVIKLIK